MSERGSKLAEFTVGRGGVKLPTIEPGYFGYFHCLNFFIDLWRLNGVDTEKFKGRADYWGRREAGRARLVIPGTDAQPTMIVRGNFSPSSKGKSLRNDGYSSLDDVGHERHTVLIERPDRATPVGIIAVNYTHVSGMGLANAMPYPVLSFMGHELHTYKFDWDEKVYSAVYRRIFEAFVEAAS